MQKVPQTAAPAPFLYLPSVAGRAIGARKPHAVSFQQNAGMEMVGAARGEGAHPQEGGEYGPKEALLYPVTSLEAPLFPSARRRQGRKAFLYSLWQLGKNQGIGLADHGRQGFPG